MRRKSFSLVLLILIGILVIIAVFLSIHLINRPNKKENNKSTNSANESEQNQTSFLDELDNLVDNAANNVAINTAENTSSENTSSENTTPEAPQTNPEQSTYSISLNEHSIKFDKKVNVSALTSEAGQQELKVEYPSKNYYIVFGTLSDKNFSQLKETENLKEYIESTYKVSLTSTVKAGNLGNLDIVVCSIKQGEDQAYFLFTPLNDSQVAYTKIFNTNDTKTLVDSLDDPLSDLSTIVSNTDK